MAKRGLLALAIVLTATAAHAQFFTSGNKSRPLPAAMRDASQTALTYFDLAASCRHVLRADDLARVRLAAWDALVAGGYLPEGADAAVTELDRLTAGAEPWTAEQCARGMQIFEANREADASRIRAMAR